MRFRASLPDGSTKIVGTLNPGHLSANVEAVARGPLPQDVYAEAKRRLTEAGAKPE